MAWQRDLCIPLIECPRSDCDALRIMMLEHTESRTALRTEGTYSTVGYLPFCGIDMPSDIVSCKECPGLIGCAGLFAAGCAVTIDQAGWRSRGRVSDIMTSAAAGCHCQYYLDCTAGWKLCDWKCEETAVTSCGVALCLYI